VLNDAAPIPLPCAPATAFSLEDGDEIAAMTASLEGQGDVVDGEITGFHPRGIETDLRLSFGEAGGPAFTREPARVVGLTSLQAEPTAGGGDVLVVRAGVVCEALATARSTISETAPPAPTALPLEPTRGFPREASSTAPPTTSAVTIPPVVSSSDFDVAFVTPETVVRARAKAGWTGGRSARAPEAEAMFGRLTDFGAWSEYFGDAPAVLVVRVAPKLVEGFWKRLAREAARTQGAALPPFKDFKTSFLRLRASCGSTEVTPIHPFVIEHAIGDARVVREGLYVFGPDAFGPHCGSVTLTLWSEQAPEKADTLTIDPNVVDQIWQDFAPYRAAAR
jgi:hypothetical protein